MNRLFNVALALLVLLAGCTDEQLLVTRLEASNYTVPRYTNYPNLTIYSVHNPSPFTRESITISASCQEDTYDYLYTDFVGSFSIAAGQTKDVRLAFEDGYPYFTDFRIGCNFDVEDWSGGGTVMFSFID